ncbi:MAG TPA: SUMF1/EgtB/PvdO family nonheme iron enzyme [Pyrinomonadaceae bacterium]|nr:SUMF1/EgtB/PvdO family nonheme iron enzyme [Pyrinomonadaceae bacterium]
MSDPYDDEEREPEGDFGATTPLAMPREEARRIREEIDSTGEIEPQPRPQPAPQQQPRPAAAPRRGIPAWVWIIAGVFFLAVVGFVLFFVLLRNPGFTMVVRGAPPGSSILVDNVSHGVTSGDGSIKVPGLKPGKRVVRVTHDGYQDFNTSVSGDDGEVKTVIAQLVSTGQQPVEAGLPREIDYNGTMLLVAAGEFVMGDDNHQPDESPAHKLSLPDFYIDRTEVTNEQYKKFCDATHRPYPTNPWWDDHYFAGSPKAPVLGVNFDDAAAYAKWAGKRLPTEVEWEKAASWDAAAQTKRQYPWGDSPDTARANMGGTRRTTNVGNFSSGASPYGVMDMAGNVAEWVDSFYQAYEGSQASSPDFGTQNRVVRGGTYKGDAADARTTRRLYHPPELNENEKKNRAFLIGFRCAISADDPRIQNLLHRAQ